MSLARVIAACYLALTLLGVGWIAVAGRFHAALAPSAPEVLARGAALGTALAAAVVLLSILLHRLSAWAREMERYFAGVLGALTPAEIGLAAAASAVGEEVFFRGALQPSLGLVAASLLFGGLHFPVERRLLPWTVFALAMGFALGGLYLWTGTLAAPIAAHFGVNLVNLWRITRGQQAKERSERNDRKEGDGGKEGNRGE